MGFVFGGVTAAVVVAGGVVKVGDGCSGVMVVSAAIVVDGTLRFNRSCESSSSCRCVAPRTPTMMTIAMIRKANTAAAMRASFFTLPPPFFGVPSLYVGSGTAIAGAAIGRCPGPIMP